MKALLKSLTVLALLLALISGASAAWNIRQNSDGTADFVRDRGVAIDAHAVGSVVLNAQIADLSTQSTVAVAIPITNAQISLIQSAISVQITGADALIMFSLVRDGSILWEVTNATSQMAITTESAIGTLDTFTPVASSASNAFHRGDVLVIETDGGSTNASVGNFTIVVEPR